MKRFILMFSAAMAALVSCYEEPVQEPGNDDVLEDVREVSIKAATLPKSVLSGDEVWWEGGDQIALVFTHPTEAPHVNRSFVNDEKKNPSYYATFTGAIPNSVTVANRYEDLGFAVYPVSAVTDDGVYRHDLPEVQYAKADGSFASGVNLSSSALFLSKMEKEGSRTETDFRSALSMLKLELSPDIESVTVTGSAPLAGVAPLGMFYKVGANENEAKNNGRLLVDPTGKWSEESTSVTLMPDADGDFAKQLYHILVWPGKQEGLTITVNYRNIGEYEKKSEKPVTFKPGMYYKLNFNNTEELVIEEFDGALDKVEGDVADLISQIQSVSLMTEYLDNAVKAKYSIVGSDYFKQGIELSYLVRPAEVAMQLVNQYSDAMSAVVSYRNSSGNLQLTTLPINSATVSGDVMTVTVNADAITKEVYDGKVQAQLGLQIASSTTDILSDFAKLYPLKGAGLFFTRSKDIPVIKGASVSIPFRYAPSGNNYTLSVSGNQNAGLRDNEGFFSGYINVDIKDSDLASQSLIVTLTSGDEVVETELTFAEGPKFEINQIPKIDYIGGEISIGVSADWNVYSAYSLSIENNSYRAEIESNSSEKSYIYYPWIYETFSGVSGTYTLRTNEKWVVKRKNSKGEETSEDVILTDGMTERTATAVFKVNNAELSYTMTRPIVQKAYGTGYNQDNYYNDGYVKQLNAADYGYTPLNVVILGDGYQKKDLMKGGKFERSAKSAMDSFFGAEPFTSFKNRFNVYMVAYESATTGPGNTYFNLSYNNSSTAINYSDGEKIENVVRNALENDNSRFHRSVVIILVNTDASVGATNYFYRDEKPAEYSIDTGDGYYAVGVAMLTANSTETSGLVRHEAGGHAFGRLGDEYVVDWYNQSVVNQRHSVGFFRNVATNTSYWSDFTNAGYNIQYDQYMPGLYRSSGESGIMWNNNGYYNPVSRHSIYERIIKQSEGSNAYSWNGFLDYDKKNPK